MDEALIRVSSEDSDHDRVLQFPELFQIKVVLVLFVSIEVMRRYRIILTFPKTVFHNLKVISLIAFIDICIKNDNFREQVFNPQDVNA